MIKSQTGIALPKISSRKSSLSMLSKQRARSFFVQKLNQRINEQQQYRMLESSKINEQQMKLKQILRQFNEKSHNILRNHITNQFSKSNQSMEIKSIKQQLQIAEKQFSNTQKIIDYCNKQLKKLESRCENLKYLTKQEMESQILQHRKKIISLTAENKQLERWTNVDGLFICRGEKKTGVKDIEYQRVLLQFKKQELVKKDTALIKDIQLTKDNCLKAQKQVASLEASYKQILSAQAVIKQLEINKDKIKEKKKYLQGIKSRSYQHASGLKQAYTLKLKQLDSMAIKIKQQQNEIIAKEEALLGSRKQLMIMQHKFTSIKQGSAQIKM